MSEREASADIGIERQIIAAYMLRGADTQDEIESLVSEADLYSGAHETCFSALKALRKRGAPTDTTALESELKKMGKLASVGGYEALLNLTDSVPPARSIEALCGAVANLASVRRMQDACAKGYGGGFGVAAHDASSYLDDVSANVQRAAERRLAIETSTPLGEVARTVMHRAVDAFTRGAVLTGLTTGFDQLDHMTTGMHGGDLWIVAGRPGMGKSAAAQAMALKVAIEGEPALIISLEMPKPQWAERALSSISSVYLERIRAAQFVGDDLQRLGAAQSALDALPIEVDDSRSSVVDVRIKARRMKRKYGRLGAVFVDYLQLMKPTTKTDSREQAVSEMSRGLKSLAMELNVPVVALAQVNRVSEKASDKRPQLSDLRESGAIEQDADTVMFVYRDEVYHKDTEAKGMGEFIVRKQRNGPTGTVGVRYVAPCVRFQNAESGYGR